VRVPLRRFGTWFSRSTPSSAKTLLARRLVQDRPDFVRISGDDLRKMLINEPIPSRDEELLYSMLALIRDELLGRRHNAMIDTTPRTNGTRFYLMGTRSPSVLKGRSELRN
jgi:hypothetical protein